MSEGIPMAFPRFPRFPRFRRSRTESQLDRAILATRRAGELPGAIPSLSDAAKARILEASHSRDQSETQPLPAVFPSRPRLIAVGTLPVVLGVALLALLNGLDPGPVPVTEPAGTLASARVFATVVETQNGEEVRFLIRNGDRPHRVLRSTSPQTFDAATAVTVEDGSYGERLADPAALVFYRIE
jgi:hypothetical protein